VTKARKGGAVTKYMTLCFFVLQNTLYLGIRFILSVGRSGVFFENNSADWQISQLLTLSLE